MADQGALDDYVQMVLDADYDHKAFGNNEPKKAQTIRTLIEIMAHSSGFDIDLRTVAQLIGSTESNLRRCLNDHKFLENVDYVRLSSAPTGGRPRQRLRLSLPAFKALVVLGRSPTARMVMNYFGLVEEMYREGKMDAIIDRRGREDESVRTSKRARHLTAAAGT